MAVRHIGDRVDAGQLPEEAKERLPAEPAKATQVQQVKEAFQPPAAAGNGAANRANPLTAFDAGPERGQKIDLRNEVRATLPARPDPITAKSWDTEAKAIVADVQSNRYVFDDALRSRLDHLAGSADLRDPEHVKTLLNAARFGHFFPEALVDRLAEGILAMPEDHAWDVAHRLRQHTLTLPRQPHWQDPAVQKAFERVSQALVQRVDTPEALIGRLQKINAQYDAPWDAPALERLAELTDWSAESAMDDYARNAGHLGGFQVPDALLPKILGQGVDSDITRSLRMLSMQKTAGAQAQKLVDGVESAVLGAPDATEQFRRAALVTEHLPWTASPGRTALVTDLVQPIFQRGLGVAPEDAAQVAAFRRLAQAVEKAGLAKNTSAFNVDVAHQELVKGGRGLDADLQAALGQYEAGRKISSEPTKVAARLWLQHVLTDPTEKSFDAQRTRLEKVAAEYARGVQFGVLKPEERAAIVREVLDPGYRRLCDLTTWSNDTQVQYVTVAPLRLAPKAGDPGPQFPAEHLDDLFGHGHLTDLRRASFLDRHRDPRIAERAARVLSDPALTDRIDLYDALELRASTGMPAATRVLEARFRHPDIQALLDPPEHLEPRELGKRLRLVVTEWLRAPAADRDPRVFEQDIVPAYLRLCDRLDWTDDEQVRGVLGFPTLFAKSGVSVAFPEAHAASLFKPFENDRDALQKRLELVTTMWMGTAVDQRSAAVFSQGILPTYERLTDLADWSKDDVAQNLLAFPKMFAGGSPQPIQFPERHYPDLFGRPVNATRLFGIAQQWSTTPAAGRDAALLEKGLLPAYGRWCAEVDWKSQSDASVFQALAFGNLVGDARGEFPEPLLPSLFGRGDNADFARATKLLAHPSAAVQRAAEIAVREVFDRVHPAQGGAPPRPRTLDERIQLLKTWPTAPAAPAAPAKKEPAIETWRRAVHDGLQVTAGPAYETFRDLRDATIREVLALPDKELAVQKLQAVLPGSVERDALVDQAIAGPWIPARLLDVAINLGGYGARTFSDPQARSLRDAVARFPGNAIGLVEYLSGRRTADTVFDTPAADPKAASDDLEKLRAAYERLPPRSRRILLEESLTEFIRTAKRQARGQTDPKVKEALRANVLDAMEKDPDAKGLVDRLQRLFDALPEHVQARVLAADLSAPKTDDAALLIRRLLVATGVVGIKAGQQMSEDPAVPQRFRAVLEDLRDRNAEMSPAAAWKQIPPQARQKIAELGKTLGTGSVKQVMWAKLKDARVALAAVLREGIPEQIQSTMGALSVLEDTRHLADRIKPMLARETDFTLEAKAFDVLRETPVGQSRGVSVPRVIEAYPQFLLREPSDGMPLSEILRQRPLTETEKTRLYELQTMLVRSALDTEPGWLGKLGRSVGRDKTFVLTDPHQGNISDDGARFGLFDPGQYETLNAKEAQLFVRLLASFSRPAWHAGRRESLVAQLAQVARLANPNDGGKPLAERLDEAYAETFSESDANVGRKLQLLLLAASKKGVAIPDGYFGLAKMLHSLESQAEDAKMPSAVTATIRDLYLDELGPVGRLYRAVDRSGKP